MGNAPARAGSSKFVILEPVTESLPTGLALCETTGKTLFFNRKVQGIHSPPHAATETLSLSGTVDQAAASAANPRSAANKPARR